MVVRLWLCRPQALLVGLVVAASKDLNHYAAAAALVDATAGRGGSCGYAKPNLD